MNLLEVLLVGVPAAFAMMYAVFGGVALALPLSGVLRPARHLRAKAPGTYPVAWEASHGLLLGAFLAWAAIFPRAAEAAGPRLGLIWLGLVTAFVVRGLLLLCLGRSHRPWRGLRWILVGISLLIPIMLVQNVVVLLTGNVSPLGHLGITIALDALAVTLPVALWGGYFYRPGQVTRELAGFCFWLALMLALFTWPLALVLDPDILGGRGLVFLQWPVVLAAFLAIGSLASEWRRRYFAASALLATGLGLSVLLVQWPYLVRPELQIHDALTDISGQANIATLFVVMLILAWPLAEMLRHAQRR